MKKYLPYLIFVLFAATLLISACTRTQSTPSPTIDEPSPTPGVLTQLPDAIASQTAAPTPAETVPTVEPPAATEVSQNPADEPVGVAPTATEKSSTEITLVPKDKPTDTPEPTPTLQGDAFDPYQVFGDPTFVDPMNSSSYGNWKSGGTLPNSDLLQISLDGDKMYVTGKKPGFSTWYFSWPTLVDFYLQMTVKNGECSGKDEYGLIVRGPAHGAGVSYGYIVAFTCDGYYRVSRLDSADPYLLTDLVSSTKSSYILTGSDQKNMIGIKADGKKLTIFANGYQVAEVSDGTFSKGRYGVFVQAVETYNYTYRPVEIVYWELTK